MIKDECEIICDLLPLYVDEVCADRTGVVVEEHIALCAQCREKYEIMKNTRLVAEQANKKQTDFLRRLKQRQVLKNVAGMAVVLGIMLLQTALGDRAGNDLFFVVTPVLMMIALVLIDSKNDWDKKWQKWAGIGVLFMGVYEIGINEYMAYCAGSGENIFGLSKMQYGPFLANQMYVILGACVVILLVNWGWKKNNYIVGCLCIGVGGLSCAYHSLYHRLDIMEIYLQSLRRIEIVMALEVLAALTLRLIAGKIRERRMKDGQ